METHLADWVYWWYIYPACIILALKIISLLYVPKIEGGLVSRVFWSVIDAVVPVWNLFYLAGAVLLVVRSILGKETKL